MYCSSRLTLQNDAMMDTPHAVLVDVSNAKHFSSKTLDNNSCFAYTGFIYAALL